jgi:hypothetical protein
MRPAPQDTFMPKDFLAFVAEIAAILIVNAIVQSVRERRRYNLQDLFLSVTVAAVATWAAIVIFNDLR